MIKIKYVNIKLEDNDSFIMLMDHHIKVKAPTDYMIGTWWNHSLVEGKSSNKCCFGKNYKSKSYFY